MRCVRKIRSVSRATRSSSGSPVRIDKNRTLGGPRPASIEEIAILLDVRRKVERVLSNEPLGQLGVAALQRLDDAHVIGNRAGRAIFLRDRHAANRPDVDEEVLDRLGHEMRTGEVDDRLMLFSAAQTSMISIIAFVVF